MKKRYWDTLGIEISTLGMGCMRLPQAAGKIDEIKARDMIDACMENGINYFDTGYSYHGGESELFLSKALIARYDRDKFYLADKLPLWLINSEEDAERIFEDQLKKTKAGYFDFYLLHGESASGWEKTKRLKLLEFIKERRERGQVQYIGFSFHDTPEVLKEIAESEDWDFAQIQLNYYDWFGELRANEMYEILDKNSIPCICMEPVRGGMLADPAPQAAERLREIFQEQSMAEIALRFTGSLSNVFITLSGMSSMDQLNENIRTFSDFDPFDDNEFIAVRDAQAILNDLSAVPCTKCNYCDLCPQDIRIPDVFSVYNEVKKFNHVNSLIWEFNNNIPEDKRAPGCIKCGKCKEVCPQQIDIPQELENIENEYIANSR